MRKKQDLTEAKTDLDSLSTAIRGRPSSGRQENGHALPEDLARAILEQRKFRLERQNRKLDLEIAKHELTFGDIEQFRNEVRRCNAAVKLALRAMVIQVSPQLVGLPDAAAIQHVLMRELVDCFNNLAYEGGSITGM